MVQNVAGKRYAAWQHACTEPDWRRDCQNKFLKVRLEAAVLVI